ncbi:MAG: hypothetical protein C4562_07340 [Actinobacteria bacterium]|nr:MAG: hypothetical protein C4562_07340 [Actinomycetota bacterium]
MNNPGLIKLDLFCKGIKIDSSCNLEIDARQILRCRGGLGSGLEIILPDNLYVNVPVEEHFVRKSPYTLYKQGQEYLIRKKSETVCQVILPACPKFYHQKTSSGKLMSRIGVMQGTYLGIYPTKICSFWEMKPSMNCHFCSVGLNVGHNEELVKSVSDVIETVKAARAEEKITFVHFNTGFFGGVELDELEPYILAVKKETGLLVGVQTPPNPDLKKYDYLKRIGVDHLSFCIELFNYEKFEQLCPGKSRYIGQDKFLETIKYCSKLFGKGRVAGEIIAGLEPVEDSIKAIEHFASIGAVTTVCVFRPCLGTKLEREQPPDSEEIIPIFKAMYEECIRNSIPIGIAPNINVSLVLLPEEGRYFTDTRANALYLIKLLFMKVVFRIYFRLKQLLKRQF